MRPVFFSSMLLVACAKRSAPPEQEEWPEDTHNNSEVVRAAESPKAPEGGERWIVSVELGKKDLELQVDFFPTIYGWSANLGVPMQSVWNVPMRGVEYTDSAWQFVNYKPQLPSFSEIYRAERTGDTATGTMTMKGNSYPIIAQRSEKGPLIKRPQTPKGPLPYAERTVQITNGEVVRTGTLSVPPGEGPFPGVVIESGSGAQDRDGLIFGHQLYRVLADHLSRNGIAVLRVDDRGVGESTGNPDSTHSELVGDLRMLAYALADAPEVDASRVGLIGHSQGATIAPLAAIDNPSISYVVLLCGMGKSGIEVLLKQKADLQRMAGLDDKRVQASSSAQKKVLEALRREASAGEQESLMMTMLRIDYTEAQWSAFTDKERAALADQARAQLQSNTIKDLVKVWPDRYLSELRVPVLAVHGELDLQVSPVNSYAMKTIFSKMDIPYELYTAAKTNHLLQPAETGMVDEYAQIETTINPEVLEKVSGWITGVTSVELPAPSEEGEGPKTAEPIEESTESADDSAGESDLLKALEEVENSSEDPAEPKAEE